jgi:hypothetical protein
MVFVLLGYFSTMVTALIGFMMLLNAILEIAPSENANSQARLSPMISHMGRPEPKVAQGDPAVVHRGLADARTAAVAQAPTAVRTDAENGKRSKMARDQQRKMLAQEREPRDVTAALGYNEPPSFSAAFDPFGPRRF